MFTQGLYVEQCTNYTPSIMCFYVKLYIKSGEHVRNMVCMSEEKKEKGKSSTPPSG